MSKKYLIKLTPLDTFFFGGESTFGEGLAANYLAKSNLFPQQTALLGVLRHQLLIQHNCINGSDADKIALIGAKSFSTEAESVNTYGKIACISPVFMTNEGNNYFVRSREFVTIGDGNVATLTLKMEVSNCKTSLNGKERTSKSDAPWFETDEKDKYGKNKVFSPKNPFAEQLVSKDKKPIEIDDVFKKSEKVGITKYKDGRPQTGGLGEADNGLGFYKQTSYRLQRGWSFAFFAILNDETSLVSSLVQFGGENRPFRMEVEPLDTAADLSDFEDLYQDAKKPSCAFDRIVLLSDAYLPSSVYDDCVFANTDIVNFRNIKTTVAVKNYASMGTEAGDKPYKATEKRNLLSRGSVLYTKNATVIEELLKKSPFHIIGYNYYKTIKKNQ
jgi:CRISPR-associated protein Cmr3